MIRATQSDSRFGPYCTVPGCTDTAEGAVLFAYVKEQRRYLCATHMRPIRLALVDLLAEPAHEPLAVGGD